MLMYSLPLKTSISHPTWRWYRCWVYTSIRTAVILNASTYTLVLYKGDIYMLLMVLAPLAIDKYNEYQSLTPTASSEKT